MSDFLERLSHRAVLPTVRQAGVAPLEPRLPGRYESLSPRAHADDVADLVEEHVDVPARAAAPSVPSTARPAPATPSPDEPAEARPGAPPREEATSPVVPSPGEPLSADPDVTGTRPLRLEIPPASRQRMASDLPAPALSAAQEPAHRDGARAQPPPPATAAPLEPVIVVHRVPAPIPTVPASPSGSRRPLSAARSRTEPTTSPTPEGARRAEVAPRAVVFEPREPLAALRLEPLADHEVLAMPALADVATPDGVVHVHIGRLEVSRPAPAPPSPAPRRRVPTLSLDDYLAQRTTGGVDGGHRR